MGTWKVGKPCKRLVPVGTFINEDGDTRTEYGKCGAMTTVYSWREIDGARYKDTTCTRCDAAPAEEDNKCGDCGQSTASQEGLCYQCQTIHHAAGDFDMDGPGWIR